MHPIPSPKTPFQLGQESAGQDVDCPYGQYDEDTSAWDEWHDGREQEEQRMGDEYADYCDPSMRDCYE